MMLSFPFGFTSRTRYAVRRPKSGSSRRKPLRMETLESRCVLSTFTVNTLSDTVDADPAVTSLREAITAANSLSDADIIGFAPSVAGTITLASGELAIANPVDLQGPGAGILTVSG